MLFFFKQTFRNTYEICLFHHHGYRNVIVSELSEIRRQISRQLQTGFQIVSPDELRNLMPKSKTEAEVEGVDVIIDCTGSPKALEQAMAYVARGATILGVCNVVGSSIARATHAGSYTHARQRPLPGDRGGLIRSTMPVPFQSLYSRMLLTVHHHVLE